MEGRTRAVRRKDASKLGSFMSGGEFSSGVAKVDVPDEVATASWRRGVHPTVYDVALEAGVSVMTVSRVVNGTGYVSQKTRERVLQAIEKLGYRPNAMARGLVTRRSNSIGVIISDITNPFFPQVIRGIEDALAPRRYHVVLADTDGDPARDAEAIGLMLEQQVDGLILAASRAPDAALIQALERGVSVVLINRLFQDHPRAASVLTNARRGARAATAHLIGLGHSRIAYIAGPEASWSNKERLAGYREALEEAGIVPCEAYVVSAEPATIQGGMAAADWLLGLPERPTALIAFDDLIAIGAIKAAVRRRVRVPDDLAVVGFDDIELAAFINPALTTVRQPKYEMGRVAAELMLAMLSGDDNVPRVQFLTEELVVRRSSGDPAGDPGELGA